jgi:hypothetical protein
MIIGTIAYFVIGIIIALACAVLFGILSWQPDAKIGVMEFIVLFVIALLWPLVVLLFLIALLFKG